MRQWKFLKLLDFVKIQAFKVRDQYLSLKLLRIQGRSRTNKRPKVTLIVSTVDS